MVQGYFNLGKKCLIVFFILKTLVLAQNQQLFIEDSRFNRSISCMYQDSFGFLWYGTDNGLYRFDGERYNTYKINPYKQNSISDDEITDIHETNDQILVIGTKNGGLNLLDLKTDQFIKSKIKTINPDNITTITVTTDYTWIGTKDDIYFYEHKVDSLEIVPIGLNKNITDIEKINDENLLATTKNDGFYVISLENNKELTINKVHYLGETSVKFAFPVMDKIFLIASDQGFTFLIGTPKNLMNWIKPNFQKKFIPLKKMRS